MLLLPVMSWSLAPAMGLGAEFCPAPEAVEAVMHACCPSGPSHSKVDHPAPAPPSGTHHPTPGTTGQRTVIPFEAADSSASPGNPDNCACLPARDRPASPAELPAVTFDASTSRVPDSPGAVSVLPANGLSPTRSLILRCPEESRRLAAGPPLFLLHELLLI